MNTNTDISGRRLPFSLEAEQSLLGSLLIRPEAITEIITQIKAEHFYLEQHAHIYEAMTELFIRSSSIDVTTLINELVKNGTYSDEDSTKRYIRLLAEIVPSAVNVKDYAAIVSEKSILRSLIEACDDINSHVYAEDDTVTNLIDYAEQKIYAISTGTNSKGFVHIRDVLLETYDRLKTMESDPESIQGIPTGFTDLDNVLVGMGAGDLILVGARPGMGKTSFAMNIATQVARKSDKAVCVFSLEMSCEQLVSRMLSSEALIDSYNIRSGKLTPDDWTKLAQASSRLSSCNILIDDTSGLSVAAMKSKLRRVEKNLGLVVIDYLQLMQSDRHNDNRVQEVAEISRGLKLLAKELKVPLICCAQLSRGPESRTDKRPMLSDLRDSGAIEQDADVVMFLYRDDYYKNDAESQNSAEIMVAKNRHGSTKNIPIGWFGQYTKFTTLSNIEGGGKEKSGKN